MPTVQRVSTKIKLGRATVRIVWWVHSVDRGYKPVPLVQWVRTKTRSVKYHVNRVGAVSTKMKPGKQVVRYAIREQLLELLEVLAHVPYVSRVSISLMVDSTNATRVKVDGLLPKITLRYQTSHVPIVQRVSIKNSLGNSPVTPAPVVIIKAVQG